MARIQHRQPNAPVQLASSVGCQMKAAKLKQLSKIVGAAASHARSDLYSTYRARMGVPTFLRCN
jgi:hypothetical protein